MTAHHDRPLDLDTLRDWLRERVAHLLERQPSQIATQSLFSELGLESADLVALGAAASEELEIDLAPTVLFDYPSIDTLAAHLVASGAHAPRMADASPGAGAAALPRGDARIAIIGMDCRFPGADGLEAYWDLLSQGHGAIREIPAERARMAGWRDAPDAAWRFAGFVDDIAGFDAAMFGIAGREAQGMDPQQRMLLETAWHALERANVAPDGLAGTATGVFVGIFSNDYFRVERAQGAQLHAHAGTGGAPSIAANRISYCFGLQGPSMSIDTACSSSLVAMHQACASLARGECDLALAGGVNLVLSDDLGTIFANAGMLAPDGQCKTFDAAANGYVRGEGCGMLVLKRLDDALRDGNHVLAVIAGSAVNQDGRSNGLTAPNGLAQQQVVRGALRRAGAAGRDLDYVETHGTGTSLGDPIEVAALRAVLDTEVCGAPCWLGAVKTQIGHLEAAAGAAGVIKAVLALQHGLIPANRNFSTLNPKIDLNGSRLRPAIAPVAWPRSAQRVRRAGVSSFGFGGTNAHLVLEEAPWQEPAPQAAEPDGPLLHVISARTPTALRELAQRSADALAWSPPSARALSWAARAGRAQLPERLSIAAPDGAALQLALQAFARGEPLPAGVRHAAGNASRSPQVAFLYTGQGAQYAGMGASLFEKQPVFRATLLQCDRVLRPILDVALPELLFGTETPRLADTRFAQPALVSLQIALTAVWTACGVKPQWVCGHSVGEYAAAHAAGMLDLPSVLRLVATRARLMAQAQGAGAMLSVAASESDALRALGTLAGDLDIAGRNSPRQTVIAGPVPAIEAALERFASRGHSATRLPVSHAFHSRLMEPVVSAFADELDGRVLARPGTSIVATGGLPDADMTQPSYWAQQIREGVRFEQALRHLRSQGAQAFIEIGPGATLLGLARDTLGEAVRIPSLHADTDAALHLCHALGSWWAAGGRPQLAALGDSAASAAAGTAPTYPFERQPFWFEPGAQLPAQSSPGTGLAGRAIELAESDAQVFEVELPQALPELVEHVVAGAPVMPGAGLVALALAALQSAGHGAPGWEARDIRFAHLLELSPSVRVQTRLRPAAPGESPGNWQAAVHARDAQQARWHACMTATVAALAQMPAAPAIEHLPQAAWRALDSQACYDGWAARGLVYGPAFRRLKQIALAPDRARARLGAAAAGPDWCDALPAWLDAAIQLACAACRDDPGQDHRVCVPVALKHLAVLAPHVGAEVSVQARVLARDGRTVTCEVRAEAPDGTACLQLDGLQLTWLDAGAVRPADAAAQPAAAEIAPVPGAGRPDARALAALEKAEAMPAIRRELAVELAAVLRQTAESLHAGDAARFDGLRLSMLGLDSLMAMEMRNRVRGWLGIDLIPELWIGTGYLGEMVEMVYEEVLLRGLVQRPATGGAGADADEEVEVMLL